MHTFRYLLKKGWNGIPYHNLSSIPIATKLRAINAREIMEKEVICEGILSIQAGENPRVIEEKLKSFLAPNVRDSLLGGDGNEQGGES